MKKHLFTAIGTISLIIGLSYLSACQNSNSANTNMLMKEQKIKNLSQENISLKEKIKQYELRHPSTSFKYAFVLLNVTQEELTSGGYSHHKYFCTTGIEQWNSIDETLKYQILDQAQQSYLKDPMRHLDKGTVSKRELLVFDSYEEASKEKEKYTISHQ